MGQKRIRFDKGENTLPPNLATKLLNVEEDIESDISNRGVRKRITARAVNQCASDCLFGYFDWMWVSRVPPHCWPVALGLVTTARMARTTKNVSLKATLLELLGISQRTYRNHLDELVAVGLAKDVGTSGKRKVDLLDFEVEGDEIRSWSAAFHHPRTVRTRGN